MDAAAEPGRDREALRRGGGREGGQVERRLSERERAPGQLDKILNDLGPMPECELPDEVAFWVGALVNPLPALGVCKEVRHMLQAEAVLLAHAQLLGNARRRVRPTDREVEPLDVAVRARVLVAQ